MASKDSATQQDTAKALMKEYRIYKAAQDRGDCAAVEACMSPSCWQLARQDASWNLDNRAEIIRVLTSVGVFNTKPDDHVQGQLDMRALTRVEKDTLPDPEKGQTAREGWEGLRVVLEDADPNGLRIKVNYYWRKEEGRWVQCFHDLLWVGPKITGAENHVGATIFGQH